jgi:hypothetical protein
MSDEDKTRVLRSLPAAATAEQAAGPPEEEKTRVVSGKPGDTESAQATDRIVFTCPNGHRIVADRSHAGRRGTCSKCGVSVEIPGGAAHQQAISQPVVVVTPPPLVTPDEAIPAPGSEATEQSAAPPFPAPGSEAGGSTDAEQEGWDFIGGPASGAAPTAAEAAEGEAWSGVEPGGFVGGDGVNPTAQLLARLWLERNHGGVIELHLEGGSVILPEWFDANWSSGTHGLFASKAGESITITAVAWDTVRKVVVRNLSEMPDDMFT